MYGETRLEAGIFFSPESDGILQDHTDTRAAGYGD